MLKLIVCSCLLAFTAGAQINTSTMDGTVTDAQGALVPRAQVTVVNNATGEALRTVTDDKGHWAIPSLSTSTYRVSVTAAGFKKAEKPDVRMDAGIPATVNLVLEVGAVSETVEVVGGAEVVQSTSATVSSDLTGRQVDDLPIPSRNATDLIVTLPGTQTPAGPRNTTFDGLARDRILLHQIGAHIGGPIVKNKLFIFFNYEVFRFPQSWNEAQDKGARCRF